MVSTEDEWEHEDRRLLCPLRTWSLTKLLRLEATRTSLQDKKTGSYKNLGLCSRHPLYHLSLTYHLLLPVKPQIPPASPDTLWLLRDLGLGGGWLNGILYHSLSTWIIQGPVG